MSSNLIRSSIIALLIVIAPKGQAERIDAGRLDVPMATHKSYGPKMNALMEKALKGDPSAQFRLGEIYDKGNEWVPRDPSAAIAWYEEAAINGHKLAAQKLKTL